MREREGKIESVRVSEIVCVCMCVCVCVNAYVRVHTSRVLRRSFRRLPICSTKPTFADSLKKWKMSKMSCECGNT